MLRVERQSYSYGVEPVLKEITLEVKSGEFVGMIGPNGAGKSTFLKLIDGILSGWEDHVFWNNRVLRSYSRRDLAGILSYLPQETDFPFAFRVEEVVRMGRFPHLHGIGLLSAMDDEIVESCMRLLEVDNFRNRSFRTLSGGERQRVMIASALAQQPEVLLLDEPTTALDLHHQLAIYHTLKAQQQQKNLTVILTTHDINIAAQFCERMLLIHDGRIIKDGTPNEVLKFQTIQDVFGVKVYIDINPMTESIYILPYAEK